MGVLNGTCETAFDEWTPAMRVYCLVIMCFAFVFPMHFMTGGMAVERCGEQARAIPAFGSIAVFIPIGVLLFWCGVVVVLALYSALCFGFYCLVVYVTVRVKWQGQPSMMSEPAEKNQPLLTAVALS